MSSPACPSCHSTVAPGARFCPQCGVEQPPDPAAPTELAPEDLVVDRRPAGSGSSPSSSQGLSGARFAPGTMLGGGRYRIVGLLGRGGMGEVYRGEDLLLEQPVALKFLPEDLVADDDRLRRLLAEVRLARQVSHPNVCRVYDVGEADEHRFFSMELVEGEDLASLLTQVGRVPGAKGVEIARQLCAGLAAAHDRGVIHRDLKPANVMVDRSGEVKITDFGLALAEGLDGPDAAAGTPGYMAPEQLSGREVTQRSDIWSLGVVLYELFTGERPFRGRSLAELRREVDESHVSSPSSHVEDLDPAVERVILRCLERDPAHRPPSAVAVALALPGGDPLAAALAAGDTPSPELVAAAGGEGSLDPVRAGLLAGTALLLCGVGAVVTAPLHPVSFYDLTVPPAVLEATSRALVEDLGHEVATGDVASDWAFAREVDRWIEGLDGGMERWDLLRSARTPGLSYVTRTSPEYLRPRYGFSVVEPDNPRIGIAGESRVRLDPNGRLLALDVVPPNVGDDPTPNEKPIVDWRPLFDAADLPVGGLEPVEPRWRAPFHVDQRAAWVGEYPELPGISMRFEAAAVDGRPAFFRAIGPWTSAESALDTELASKTQRIYEGFRFALTAAVLCTSGFLAWRNFRLGRGDRRGAFRLAFWFFAAHSFCWLLWAHHSFDLGTEVRLIERDLGYNLFLAGLIWLLYLGLEPQVRRTWPETLIGWNRLLAGRFRDPRLGRDVLVGVVVGSTMRLADWALSTWGGAFPGPSGSTDEKSFVAAIVDLAVHDVMMVLMMLFALVLFLMVLRRRLLAMVALGTLVAGLMASTATNLWVGVPIALVMAATLLYVLTRHGVVATVVSLWLSRVLFNTPLTLELDRWYAWKTGLVAAVVVALVVYGFRVVTAGRGFATERLLEV